jgi:hypothetical protein
MLAGMLGFILFAGLFGCGMKYGGIQQGLGSRWQSSADRRQWMFDVLLADNWLLLSFSSTCSACLERADAHVEDHGKMLSLQFLHRILCC